MKKLQNYLLKPEELRKKLENPRFRQDFIDWSKHNVSVSRDQSRQSRSRSPVEHIQHSLQLSKKGKENKDNRENRDNKDNKENSRQGSNLRQYTSVKPAERTVLGKVGNISRANRSVSSIKRNGSNAVLSRGISESKGQLGLNNKNRYSSCASIDNPRKEKAGEEKKIKQRYSYRTRQGQQISNPNKVNQDSLVIKTSLGTRKMSLYAVADGHGAFGHQVSQYLVKNVSKCLEGELKGSSLQESIPKVFHKLQKGLTESEINASCSGSTFVGVCIDHDEIVCSNVGDSRAILARQSTSSFT